MKRIIIRHPISAWRAAHEEEDLKDTKVARQTLPHATRKGGILPLLRLTVFLLKCAR